MKQAGGRPLKVGDKVKDNDPRMTANRVLTVESIDGDKEVARDSMGSRFRYKRTRIFTDGKPRKSGLSLVTNDS